MSYPRFASLLVALAAALATTLPALADESPTDPGGALADERIVPVECHGEAVTLNGADIGVTGTHPDTGAPVTVITGTRDADVIMGTPGDDWIIGLRSGDIVCGRGGNDLIDGGGGEDVIDGGAGDDEIFGGSRSDTIFGGPGNDVIDGGQGFDIIDGDSGDDILNGKSGFDTIHGGSGNDLIRGHSGEDTLDGGGGDDVLDGGKAADILTGGAGADILTGSSGPDVLVDGGRGNDVVEGNFGDDLMVAGGDGDDLVAGGVGNDVVSGGRGADIVDGGRGNDTVVGGDGPDTVRGGTGNDSMHGGTGVDSLNGGQGDDLLFRSEYPSRDSFNGGAGQNVVATGKRGVSSGVRRYLTEDEALQFFDSSKLSDFTTYHNCCENRVINIQTMANTVSGHVIMPGGWFSVNDIVGRRTAAKGYKPAGAIIGGWIQCCDLPANMGGGTSQFGTTMYNAIFFSGLGDVADSLKQNGSVNSPHTLYFARYPAGREATMGYPDHDVRFYNDSDHPVLVTTHHGGYSGRSITVRMWGNTDGRTVRAVHSCNAPGTSIFPEVEAASGACGTYTTSRKVYRPDPSMDPSSSSEKPGQAGFAISVNRIITEGDGSTRTETFKWSYSASPIVVTTHPCNIPAGDPEYTGETCPGDGGGGGGIDPL